MELRERFDSKISPEPTSGCHLWLGSFRGKYGEFWVNGKYSQATHVALFLQNGRWPTLQVNHKCDNPPCCNPDHLYEGTSSENSFDAVRRKRHTDTKKTHCVHGHKLPEYPNYYTSRVCKPCVTIRNAARDRRANKCPYTT